MYLLRKVISKKLGILKVTDKSRIRTRTKMSRIHNTDCYGKIKQTTNKYFPKQSLSALTRRVEKKWCHKFVFNVWWICEERCHNYRDGVLAKLVQSGAKRKRRTQSGILITWTCICVNLLIIVVSFDSRLKPTSIQIQKAQTLIIRYNILNWTESFEDLDGCVKRFFF